MHYSRLSERERLQIITYRYDFHLTHRQIAKKVKCSHQTVSKVLEKHKHHQDTPQFHRSGRKKKLTKSQQNHLKNIIRENNNLTAAEIQRHFFHHDNIQLSLATIKRYRRLWFHPVKPIPIPRLTLQHHFQRIDYCMTHKDNNFHRVVFSDEKIFKLDHTTGIVWIEDGEPIPTHEISGTHTTVNVWGGIWYNGRTELAIIDNNLNANKYIEILKEFLLPSMPSSPNFFFMQDGAGPHKPLKVRGTLHHFGVKVLYPYPPNSPDFNPIEHVWSWIVNYVNGHRPTNRHQLIDLIQKGWKNIPQSVIQSYFDNLPARLQAVEKAGGARLD
jgi:putative transposase